MQRYVALLLALIPISLAVFGIKLMRDTVFGILFPPISILWLQFLIGASASGSGFISSVASSCTETVNEIKYKLALEDRNAPLFIIKMRPLHAVSFFYWH